jgi:hypothetical protein
MDHTDAREWRYFYEDLRFYELSVLESPQDFLFKIWQQKLQLHGEANRKHLRYFAKLLVDAHRHGQTHGTVINTPVLLRLKAEIFAGRAKEFVMSDGVNEIDIKPLQRVTEVFDAFIDLKTSNNGEVIASLRKLAIGSMFSLEKFDHLFSTPTSDGLFIPELIHTDQADLKFNFPFLKQYLAAQFFISHLNDSAVIEFVMRTLFTSEDYASICWFLDDHLARNLPPEDIAAKFELCLQNNWLPTEQKFVVGFPDVSTVLCKLLESKFTAIYAYLFNLLKRRPTILRQILMNTSIVKFGVESLEPDGIADLIAQLPKDVLSSHLVRTINEGGLGTLVDRNDRKTLGYFIDFVKDLFEPDRQMEFFTMKHQGFSILLRCANSSQGGNTLKYLVENLDEPVVLKLIHSKSSDGSNLLHLALRHNSQESLEFLFAYI